MSGRQISEHFPALSESVPLKTKPSTLMTIQSTATRCVQVLSRIMSLDVTLADTSLSTVAQTGRGQQTNCQAIRKVIVNRQPLTVRNSHNDPLCQQCCHAPLCPSLAMMIMPLMSEGECIGAIKLTSHTPEQRTRMLTNASTYQDYTETTTRLYINQTLAESNRKNAGAAKSQLESELFGYVKGAFTGANQKGSEGMIRQAHGGTLFLDEIGDMSLHLQAKLLRVLDRREVTPVGATHPIVVGVRVISASHRDFEQLITDNEFREDLFYRLNVVPLELPPLRAREGDIDLLIEHFMSHHSRSLARHRPALDPDTMYCLRHWPGNIRELASSTLWVP